MYFFLYIPVLSLFLRFLNEILFQKFWFFGICSKNSDC